MSRKFKKHYSGFNRDILREFMPEEELNEIDRKYTEAKLKRLERRIKEELK